MSYTEFPEICPKCGARHHGDHSCSPSKPEIKSDKFIGVPKEVIPMLTGIVFVLLILLALLIWAIIKIGWLNLVFIGIFIYIIIVRYIA